MRWKPIIILSVLLFLYVLIIFVIYKYPRIKSDIEINISRDLKNKRMKLSSEYYGDKLNRCNSYTTSDSQGLLLDEAIVCDGLKKLKATPYFYFEEFDNDSNINDWMFVNLDCTHFDKFKNINSPYNILCKNMQTLKILSTVLRDKNLLYTGFTSIDKFKPEIKKNYRKIIHIAGKSPHKGTKYLVSTWLLHPEWPLLTIICNNKLSVVDGINSILKDKTPPKNIKLITEFIEEDNLIRYMNEYSIHICTSEFEGFGHSSNEARSVEAVVLYTDMPCFQERFKDGISGITVKSKQNGLQNEICPKYLPTTEGIEQAVNKVINMSKEDLSKIGKQARQDFLKDDMDFKTRLVSLVKGTEPIPYIIHNMWISKETPYENVKIPEKYNKNMKTWRENNKNFQFKYWSGKDVLELITNNYPQYLDFYKQLEPNICKCDFARFVVVAIYGGVYIDLDFYCKKNISDLLTGDSYFVYEPKEHFKNGKNLYNGFFAASKNNPFVFGWIGQIIKNKHMGEGEIMKKTGPMGLYDYYKNNKNKILFGDPCDIMPIIDTNKISQQCNGKYNNYATTLWYEGSGWGGKKIIDSIKFIKIKNPIDGSEMLWEESEFTKNNWPDPYYEIKEKKAIFNFAKNNKPGYGVIDVGAHIGDLSIPLALALKNIGRDDVIVYAIDPSQEKCDFIEKMSLINSVSNIKILNYGLSVLKKILGHSGRDNANNGNNTGGQQWNIEKEKINLTKTNEEESNIFIPSDDLFKKGEIGLIGVYHIDVENHEIDVLTGSKNLINTCKPILLIENYIGENIKCKNKNECAPLFKTIEDINPSYKHTGFLPNGDLIFQI